MKGLTLDAGALIALERADRRVIAWIDAASAPAPERTTGAADAAPATNPTNTPEIAFVFIRAFLSLGFHVQATAPPGRRDNA